MVQDDNLEIGQRVSVDNYNGTLRYVGPVPPTKGDWAGVEWDDPNRGKHNGSKDGVTYFTCSSQNGGSFVRPHKLFTGISICEALLDRYASHDESVSSQDLFLVDSENRNQTKIETIGMEKVEKQFENLSNLSIAGLRMQRISFVTNDAPVLKQATNIKDLDLSKNLIDNWQTVAAICSRLKSLKQLNLGENIMRIPDNPASLKENYGSLQTLILNDCRLTWDDVTSCLEMWPQISELHLERNRIAKISQPPNGFFSFLKILNLSGNKIEHWENVKNLSKLLNLEQLLLENCSLYEMILSDQDFVSLCQIFLSNNKFDSLEIFNQLNNLCNLESLMIRNNPVLTTDSAKTLREIIIAKIRNLKKLNKSKVDKIERQSSELDYLKKYGKDWRESGGHQDPEKNFPSEEFKKDHPRYLELIKIHGAREDSEFIVKSTALKSDLLEVSIIVPHRSDLKPLKKKLPSSMTVGALKLLISRLTKIAIKDQRLQYVSHLNPEHVVRMDKASETLYYISLDPGDTIEVLPMFTD